MMESNVSEKPNILLFHCHDLGQYLGSYGHNIETPNIDALADDGVLFEEYYCTAPQCSPSRGSIMTGKHPQKHGLLGITNVGNWELPEDQKTLPLFLRQAGYSTCLFGIQHEVRDEPSRLGYDAVHDDVRAAHEVVDRFEATVEDLRGEQPFFASVGCIEPHLYFHRTDRGFRQDHFRHDTLSSDAFHTDPSEVEVPAYLPDEPEIRGEIADLRDLVSVTVDEAVGRLRKVLRIADIEDETLVVFTTDHGLALPRAKGTCYDSGLETALIIQGPDLPSGEIRKQLLSNVDLLPTLLDVAEVDGADNVDGQSFAPLLVDDGEYAPRKRIFASMTWHDLYVPMRAVRTDRYKYIRNFTVLPEVFMPKDVYSSRAGQIMAHEYYTSNRPAEELYDLNADPHEQKNLIEGGLHQRGSDPIAPYKYEGVLRNLRNQLEDWMSRMEDPLLDGDVAAPDLS